MRPMPLDLEAELDNLYTADYDEFIAERKRIVAALKKEGQKAEAAQVQELRKPSLPAWAVNQLVRRRRKDIDSLLAAGAALEQAQRALVGSGDRAGFAKARKQEQAVVKRLRDQAAWVLGKQANEAMVDRVAATLTAAAVTEQGRKQLAGARLTAEIAPHGFDAFAGTLPPGPPPAKRTPAPKAKAAKPPPAPADDGRRRREQALADARAAVSAAREQEAELTEERREADRAVKDARKALDAAQRKAARIATAQEAAAEAVADARRAFDAAKKA